MELVILRDRGQRVLVALAGLLAIAVTGFGAWIALQSVGASGISVYRKALVIVLTAFGVLYLVSRLTPLVRRALRRPED